MSNPLSDLADTFLPPWVGKQPITSITAAATVVSWPSSDYDSLALIDVNASWDGARWVSSSLRRMYVPQPLPRDRSTISTTPPTAYLFSDGIAALSIDATPPHDEAVRDLVTYGTNERTSGGDRLRTGMTPAMVNAVEYGRTLEREGAFGTGD